ncbi:hypothetical protein RUND412_009772 [Rhizina undulata]
MSFSISKLKKSHVKSSPSEKRFSRAVVNQLHARFLAKPKNQVHAAPVVKEVVDKAGDAPTPTPTAAAPVPRERLAPVVDEDGFKLVQKRGSRRKKEEVDESLGKFEESMKKLLTAMIAEEVTKHMGGMKNQQVNATRQTSFNREIWLYFNLERETHLLARISGPKVKVKASRKITKISFKGLKIDSMGKVMGPLLEVEGVGNGMLHVTTVVTKDTTLTSVPYIKFPNKADQTQAVTLLTISFKGWRLTEMWEVSFIEVAGKTMESSFTDGVQIVEAQFVSPLGNFETAKMFPVHRREEDETSQEDQPPRTRRKPRGDAIGKTVIVASSANPPDPAYNPPQAQKKVRGVKKTATRQHIQMMKD